MVVIEILYFRLGLGNMFLAKYFYKNKRYSICFSSQIFMHYEYSVSFKSSSFTSFQFDFDVTASCFFKTGFHRNFIFSFRGW